MKQWKNKTSQGARITIWAARRHHGLEGGVIKKALLFPLEHFWCTFSHFIRTDFGFPLHL